MADVTELRMNVAALKRVDPYVNEILGTATHVALYIFNAEANEWERTDVEGALFVYRRNGEPYHGILIMNRLNTNNLVEPVIRGLELQLQEPFLLYRNTRCRIFGIWFYDKVECIRIASMLDKLVKETLIQKIPDKTAAKNKHTVSGLTDIDIFSMLNKAQEDYNSNKIYEKNRCLTELKHGPDVTPQSVMDFFAKATIGAPQFSAEKTHQTSSLFVASHPQRSGMLQEASDSSQLKPFLQRLMSNPAHSVEHIEKQQRSVTPHSESVVVTRNKGKQGNKDKTKNGNELKLRPLSSGTIDSISASALVPTDLQRGKSFAEQTNINTTTVENGMDFLRIASPNSTGSQMASFFGPNIQAPSSGGIVIEPSISERPLSAPLCAGIETPTKPALMPPTMFTSSASKDDANSEIGNGASVAPSVNSKGELSTPGLAPSNSVSQGCVGAVKPEPLTKNQLLQAFNYLVKNDPEFVNKLHEAYVKSFAEMVH